MANVVVGILNKNCGGHLRECLNSLLKQSFRDIMIVVVDGKSTDDSVQILEETARKDKRVAYFIQNSTGTGMARNELINYVRKYFPKAEVIVWGDAENSYHPDYLRNILNVDADVVGGLSLIDSESPLGQSLWWYYNGLRGETVVGNNEAVKAYVYEKHGYPPASRTEDFFFHKMLLKNGTVFKKASNAICYVKTIDSFSEMVKWEKARVKGLWESAGFTKTLTALWLTYWLTFSLSLGYFIFVPVLLALFAPLMLVPYILTLVASSLYLWLRGRVYVKKMRIETLFFFIPFSFLDSILVFPILLKLRFRKSRR